jgi:hypothetical protein
MRLAAAVLFLVASVAQIATAQQTPAPEPVGTGVITGRVVSSNSGTPIKSVTVVLISERFRGGSAPPRRVTAEDGSFSFDKLAGGQYQLWTMHTGSGGFRGAERVITRVSLTDGQRVSDLLIKLAPSAVISGRVVDEEGQPMQQVQVQAMRWMMNSGRAILVGVANATTNDLGEYRLFNLSAGRYYIKAQPMGMGGFPGGDDDTPAERYAGEYYPGSKSVQNASAIVIAGGDEARADFQLSQEAVTKVRGRVTGIPSIASSVTIVLVGGDSGGQSTMIAKDGKFEINSVLPGTYRLMVFGIPAPDSGQGEETRANLNRTLAQQTIVVPENGLNDLEIHASSSGSARGSITGKIRMDQPGTDLSRLIVSLQSTDTNIESPMMFGQSFQQPKADGSFTLDAPGPGSYYVAINSSGPGFEDWYTKSVTFNGRDVTDDPIQLDDSSRGTLQLVVSAKGAMIEGTVTGSDDKPLPDVKVMTIPPGGKGRPELFQETTTDQAGRFKLRGVAPGDYKLVALTEADSDAAADPNFTKTLANRGTSVRVEAGGHHTVTLKVTTDTTPQ